MLLKEQPKLANDESKTFEESYERIRYMCYGIALKITQDIGLAEDSVQSAFEKIMEHKDKYFSLPPVKRDSYIVVMVRNKAIDLVRSKKHTEISIDTISETELQYADFSDVEKVYEDKEGYEYLTKLIKELPPLYQVVFEMRYVEGFSIDEISQLLDIKKDTVTTQLARARAKVKKKINGKFIVIILAVLLAVSALMLNDDVRAAITRRFPEWLRNSFSINFSNYDGDGSARYNFWKPEYVPDKFFVLQYTHDFIPIFEYGLELDEYVYGTHSSIFYVADPDYYDNLFVFFSVVWMGKFDEVMGGRIVFPVEWVEHTIIENNGIEYHLLIAHDERGERSLANSTVNVKWRYRGFDFFMGGTADPDTILRMAFSVVPLEVSEANY